jgi:hypothetical protein
VRTGRNKTRRPIAGDRSQWQKRSSSRRSCPRIVTRPTSHSIRSRCEAIDAVCAVLPECVLRSAPKRRTKSSECVELLACHLHAVAPGMPQCGSSTGDQRSERRAHGWAHKRCRCSSGHCVICALERRPSFEGAAKLSKRGRSGRPCNPLARLQLDRHDTVHIERGDKPSAVGDSISCELVAAAPTNPFGERLRATT